MKTRHHSPAWTAGRHSAPQRMSATARGSPRSWPCIIATCDRRDGDEQRQRSRARRGAGAPAVAPIRRRASTTPSSAGRELGRHDDVARDRARRRARSRARAATRESAPRRRAADRRRPGDRRRRAASAALASEDRARPDRGRPAPRSTRLEHADRLRQFAELGVRAHEVDAEHRMLRRPRARPASPPRRCTRDSARP